MPVRMRRFFGGGFGGGFGFGGGEEEEQTPKGHDVRVDLEVLLSDLYVGTTIRVRPSGTCDSTDECEGQHVEEEGGRVRSGLYGSSLMEAGLCCQPLACTQGAATHCLAGARQQSATSVLAPSARHASVPT